MASSKAKEWITKEGLIKIGGWARDGLSNDQIAHNIGVAVSTFYVWKLESPELSEAIKKSKEVVDREVENAMHKSALGYFVEEIKETIEKDELGKDRKRVERNKKWIAPNPTSQIFWLKNRKPKEWRDKQERDLNHGEGINIRVGFEDDEDDSGEEY